MDNTSISWPVACPIREISAMTSKACMRPWEPNLQQKDVACSAGDRHQGKFGQKPYAWEKKLEMGISQLDKGTRSVVHESSKEFGQMKREKLQEFAMILSKEYHYSFPAEYFEDYHGSFNKEDFLNIEQLKKEYNYKFLAEFFDKPRRNVADDHSENSNQKRMNSDNHSARVNPNKLTEEDVADVEEKNVESELHKNSDERDENVAKLLIGADGLIVGEPQYNDRNYSIEPSKLSYHDSVGPPSLSCRGIKD